MSAPLLKIYKRMQWLPFGQWLFSKAVCRKAPYFGSIKPTITTLEPGLCCATIPKRKAVFNHIGTIHAIAQCNLAELCAGVMVDATVPHKTHRWIPKGMTVQYLKKAETNLRAQASIELPRQWQDKEDLIVPVEVFDEQGNKVFHADINMYITAR
ncbi:hotdog fold domain-containing protein [Pseudoalteromonas holothuriae]|uniref:hotdog fold domain-containing protein n=1 Tax=Pseudoalteromonas holothuriae TaxID=2963714 RepID=UPI0021BFA68E|nr:MULTISPECIES: hotdog fold domain-containing protein [unclassified Pseudoalteromonas]